MRALMTVGERASKKSGARPDQLRLVLYLTMFKRSSRAGRFSTRDHFPH